MAKFATLKDRSFQAVFWALLQNGSKEILSLVTFLVLARFFLSSGDFGVVVLATAFVALGEVFMRFGLPSALIQRKDATEAHRNAVFWTTTSLGFLGVVLLSAAAPALSRVLSAGQLAAVLPVMSLNLVLVALACVHEAELRRALQFKALAQRTLIAGVLASVCALSAAFVGFGLWSLVAWHLVSTLTSTVLLWHYSAWRPRLGMSVRDLRDLLSTGVHVTTIGLTNYGLTFVDRLIVGALIGVEELGIYHIGRRLVHTIMVIFSQSANAVTLPVFSSVQEDVVRVRRGLLQGLGYAAAISVPISGVLMFAAEPIVRLLLGPQWLAVAPVLVLLSVGHMVGGVTVFNQPLMIAISKGAVAARINAVLAVTFAGAVLAGSPWGVIGVSAASMLNGFVVFAVWAWVLRRHLGVEPPAMLYAVRAPLAALGVMGMAIVGSARLLDPLAGEITVLAGSLLLGGLAYLGALRLLDRATFGFLLAQSARLLPAGRRSEAS